MTEGRVVVGFGGGPPGRDALAFGVRWCQSSGDILVVATVHPGQAPVGAGRVDAEWVAYEREEVAALLDQARALVPEGVKAEFRSVDAGSASHGLHELAEDAGTPLVVLGSRRAAETARTFPGSTAVRVFSGAGSPVAIVPGGYAAGDDGPLTQVTTAFVDTADGRVALQHGSRIARHLKADLRVVTVVPDTLVEAGIGDRARFGRDQRADYERALAAAVATLDHEPKTAVLDGGVAETLAEIGPDEADLIVVGSRGYGPVRRVLLGGVANRVVRHARVPVVVVPRGEG